MIRLLPFPPRPMMCECDSCGINIFSVTLSRCQSKLKQKPTKKFAENFEDVTYLKNIAFRFFFFEGMGKAGRKLTIVVPPQKTHSGWMNIFIYFCLILSLKKI